MQTMAFTANAQWHQDRGMSKGHFQREMRQFRGWGGEEVAQLISNY